VTSIIVPAHNEEASIKRCLSCLVEAKALEDDIIVVCNGCSDRTAEIARQFAKDVVVVEVDIPSKTNALNVGDSLAKDFPRFYVDADVCLSAGAIREMAAGLNENILAVSPTVEMDFEGSSWAVRMYYHAWMDTPYVKAGLLGGGVYGLSADGRRRFAEFPDIVADDGFVRALFKEHERCRVTTAVSTVYAPRRLSDLLKIKTRSRRGVYELKQKFPELQENEVKGYREFLISRVKGPGRWLEFGVYVAVNIVTRLRARRLSRTGFQGWERDESSRASYR
jgi:glycosyltransferase involved in cell wall biosynthesis